MELGPPNAVPAAFAIIITLPAVMFREQAVKFRLWVTEVLHRFRHPTWGRPRCGEAELRIQVGR